MARPPARSSPSFLRLPAGRVRGVWGQGSGVRSQNDDIPVTDASLALLGATTPRADSSPRLQSAPRTREASSHMVVQAVDVESRVKTVELDIAGRTLSLETGLIAEQA